MSALRVALLVACLSTALGEPIISGARLSILGWLAHVCPCLPSSKLKQ